MESKNEDYISASANYGGDLNSNWYRGKEILITGGTGSLGKTLTKLLIKKYNPKGIRILSRDEFKQHKMKKELSDSSVPISYLIGDVKDYDRLLLAMRGVDIVIHTAAMKHIDICELNPMEAVKVNILGSLNVIRAAITTLPMRVMNVSTDKAVSPINFYGMTKGCSEKMFIHSNVYSACKTPIFSCCRYGNVLGSRGSVIPLFRDQIERENKVTVTDQSMTRFWILLEDVAEFLLQSIIKMKGGEIFIPKIPSSSIYDVIQAIAPLDCSSTEIETIGVRRGEKLHETLINKEEWNRTTDEGSYYIIHNKNIREDNYSEYMEYSSQRNSNRINVEELKKLIEKVEKID